MTTPDLSSTALRALASKVDARDTLWRDERLRLSDTLRALAAKQEATGWQDIATAKKDENKRILAVVNGEVRIIAYGKTSHVPIWGWCLADQGAEEFDLCEPTHWMPMPTPPAPGGPHEEKPYEPPTPGVEARVRAWEEFGRDLAEWGHWDEHTSMGKRLAILNAHPARPRRPA
jgi:hypothetical protein